jgi:uncharacterized membrane protein YczE
VTAPPTDRSRPWQLRLGVFLTGTLLVGAGIGTMVTADLGVAPTDVLSTGVAELLGINVGLAAWAIGTLLTFVAWAAGRPPTVGTFLGSVLVGSGAAAMLAALPEVEAAPMRVGLLAAGLAVIYAGIGAIVASAGGTGPLELLMLALADRGIPVHRARWLLEGTLLVTGAVLGGQIGLGTVLFAVLTGPVLAWLLPPMTRWMGTAHTLEPAVT